MPIETGQTLLGKYTILRTLGEGGMGRVWLAEEIGFDHRQVALKEVRFDRFKPDERAECEERFQREIDLSARLATVKAPYVVTAITAETLPDGTRLLVMEYAAGGSVADEIAAHPGGLPSDQAVTIVQQVCQALAVFHDLPAAPVHRDIKPSNILLTSTGEARLSDFGLSQVAGASSGRTTVASKSHPGTLLYMAPEQEQQSGYLAPTADIYALGCVLFELLTGKRYKTQRPNTRPSALNPAVPKALDAVVLKAVSATAWDRYATADEFGAALARATPAHPPVTRRFLWAAVGLLAVVILAFALWNTVGRAGTPPPPVTPDVPAKTDTISASAAIVAVATATDTPVPTVTDTPVPTATDTPVPTATDTPVLTAAEAAGGPAVGIVLPFFEDDPSLIQYEARFKELLGTAGVPVEILFSQADSAKEKANVESLLSKGVKVIILYTWDGAAAAAGADAAKAAGAKVISYDSLILGTDAVDYYVTFDSSAVGAAQGQYLVDKATGKGNPLYLYAGAASDNYAFLFLEGSWKVLQPKIADGTFVIKNSSEATALQDKATLTRDEMSKIIGQVTTNWDFNTAKNLAEANLTVAKPEDKGNVSILGPNDGTARAIADAFAADKDVVSYVITGQDAEKASVQYIIDGKQSMTVLKDTRTLADDAISAAIAYLQGQTPPLTNTYYNGKIDVPAKLSEVIVVDKNNVKAAIIDSGYWPASDFTGLQ